MRLKLTVVVLGVFLFQCQENINNHSWYAMDTNMSVVLYGKRKTTDDLIFAKLESETERLNSVFSDFSDSSALSKIKGNVGDTVPVTPELYRVLSLACDVGIKSHGAFDITLHQLKWVWGLGSGQTGKVPSVATLDSFMRDNPNYKTTWESDSGVAPITLIPPHRAILHRNHTELDLGAIAKGYIVDRLHDLLDSMGAPNHILQAGGEIRLGGHKDHDTWKVGIRNPRIADSLSGLIEPLSPKAISTSGDYERFFIQEGIRYHHIFDPRSGRPAAPVIAVTVVGDSSILTDALSTALFVLGPERGSQVARHYHCAAVWFFSTTGPELKNPNATCAVMMPEIKEVLKLNDETICSSAP